MKKAARNGRRVAKLIVGDKKAGINREALNRHRFEIGPPFFTG
jgi:hypothetical protein